MEKLRVFIVDDSEIARVMLKRMLETDENIEIVGEAATGQGGIIMLDECNPDIIFIEADISGGMKIEDVIKEVKKLNSEIKIILSVSAQKEQLIIPTADVGADNFIIKPYIKQKVLRTVKEVSGR